MSALSLQGDYGLEGDWVINAIFLFFLLFVLGAVIGVAFFLYKLVKRFLAGREARR